MSSDSEIDDLTPPAPRQKRFKFASFAQQVSQVERSINDPPRMQETTTANTIPHHPTSHHSSTLVLPASSPASAQHLVQALPASPKKPLQHGVKSTRRIILCSWARRWSPTFAPWHSLCTMQTASCTMCWMPLSWRHLCHWKPYSHCSLHLHEICNKSTCLGWAGRCSD